MFGLLGPNGAGKSTLKQILAPLQEADTGSARLIATWQPDAFETSYPIKVISIELTTNGIILAIC